jgi:alkylation response protein AidB-like acyl-CoA dehydrogenase
MDFDLTEEHRIFQDAIRDFAEKEIAPLVDEAEETNIFPKQLFKKMGALGFLCPRYPVELGGGGGDKIMDCIMAEELNKVNAGIAASLMVQGGLSTQPIYRYGTDEQKQRFLMPAIKGEKIAAFALTEPDSGSDAASIKTRAQRDGNDYILNGTKIFTTNGPICDFATVAAYTDPTKRGVGINLLSWRKEPLEFLSLGNWIRWGIDPLKQGN